MSKKNWKRVFQGIWRNKSGTLYERPQVDGKWTFRSLKTSDLEEAKTEFYRRRSGKPEEQPQPAARPAPATAEAVTPSTPPSPPAQVKTVLVGEVIQRYAADGYRDRHRQRRPETTEKAEASSCEMLLKFWEKISVDDVTLGACDRYHTWRTARVASGTGDRTVDLELTALNNAFIWACRCELVRFNPLASNRPRYRSDRSVQHCRKFMVADADELHKVAALLFAGRDSVVFGWQSLVEAYTGLRTCEVLALRTDAAPHQPGWITPDGKSLCVWRSKNQDGVNPFVAVNEGLRQTLEALFRWKREHHPESPWYLPSPHRRGRVVSKNALSHSLRRVRPKLGRKITSHGFRAFYVTVRRSNGIMDSQIAWEIGHTSGGPTLIEVYGGVPPHWITGDGPKMAWLPATAELAWNAL
jgi:integrase